MEISSISVSFLYSPVFYIRWIGLGATLESKLGTFDDAIDLWEGHLWCVTYLKTKYMNRLSPFSKLPIMQKSNCRAFVPSCATCVVRNNNDHIHYYTFEIFEAFVIYFTREIGDISRSILLTLDTLSELNEILSVQILSETF